MILFCDIVVADEGGDNMQREEYTMGTWCVRWFECNRHKWNPRTEGGYRNLIERNRQTWQRIKIARHHCGAGP